MNLKEHEDLLLKVEKAKEKITRLRKQQTELEREKAELEELRGKQEEWSRGKKALGDALMKALAILEREESETTRMEELIRNSRGSLSAAYEDLKSVREEKWTSATLKDELTKALVIIEAGRKGLSKARARIPALDGKKAEELPSSASTSATLQWKSEAFSAGELLRIGFWLALPLAIMIIAVILLFLMI